MLYLKGRLLVLLVSILWIGGCIPQLFMAMQEPTSIQYAGTTPVRVINKSGVPICSVQIMKPGDFNVDNWMGTEPPLAVGEAVEFSVVPQNYSVIMEGCDGLSQFASSGVNMTRATELVLYDVTAAPPEDAITEGFARQFAPVAKIVRRPVAVSPRPAPSASSGFSPSPSNPTPKAAAPAPVSRHYSLTLKNNCREKVLLFLGDKPKFGSGTKTSIGGNSIRSFSGNAPQTIWIIDGSERGLSSMTTNPGSARMQIVSSCTGFAPN